MPLSTPQAFLHRRRLLPDANFVRRSAVAILVSTLCACGGGSDRGGESGDAEVPTVLSFTATPGAIAAGGEARLSWGVSGADEVRIDPSPGLVASFGSRILRPSQSTVYTLTASNSGGHVVRDLRVNTREYDWSAVEALLDQQVGDTVPGYVFLLMVDGARVLEISGGNLSVDSRLLIASASKALSSAAMLTLVRDGLLDLDRPVGEYLGEAVDWPADKAGITTRMLLNHSSGLADDDPCLDDPTSSLSDCVRAISAQPLRFDPGTRFAYGGNGYQVAGLIAEQLSGLSFRDFFRSRLATPLEMESTRFVGSNPRVAGGAVSNARDYLRFAQMILASGRAGEEQFLPARLVASLRVSQTDGLILEEQPPGANFDGYSLGWWISPRSQLAGLSRGPEISDPGAFGTVPWLDFNRRYSAILMLQSDVFVGVGLWDQLRPLILQQLAD